MSSAQEQLQNLQKIGKLKADGQYFDDEQLIKELIAVTKELQVAVAALGPVGS